MSQTLLSAFYRHSFTTLGGNWGLERCTVLLKVRQLDSGERGGKAVLPSGTKQTA